MVLRKRTKSNLLKLGLFLLVLFIHLVVIIQQGVMTDDTFNMFRQFDSITQSGKPLFTDALSLGGSESIINPFIYYLLTPLFLLTSSLMGFLLVIGALVSFVSVIAYSFVEKYDHRKIICFFVGFFTAVNPLIFHLYETGLFYAALFIPLTILFFYCFFSYSAEHSMKKKAILGIVLTLLVILSPQSYVGLFFVLIFLTIQYFEKKDVDQSRKELFIYLSLLYLFTQYVLYHSFFIKEGILTYLLQSSLQQELYLSFFTLFAQIILPFLLVGLFAFYRSFRIRTNMLVLFAFCVLSGSIFLFFLEIDYAYLLLIYSFVALLFTFPYTYKFSNTYWSQSKVAKYRKWIHLSISTFFIIFLLVFVVQFFFPQTSNNQILAPSTYEWIEQNTPDDAIFYLFEKDANQFMYYTNRATFVDSSKLDLLKGRKRMATQTKLYQTLFESFALKILRDQKIVVPQYMIWRSSYETIYGPKPAYLGSNCFTEVFANETTIYEVRCLEEKNGN